ncbi:hypothetical protein CcCBS67573_g06867 [Chytriomyces confervae]|uniref:Alpha 1,4-glycosyltransferase domain-containing protein n=1 Tax=Chytriomyces confervae TaxID=246404 RepID=A0A507F041_9FUNG|nr:hypothetical protein CcCBS67573_g06867 [Chytriomyces confervae]
MKTDSKETRVQHLTREELIAENQSLFEEMNSMEQQHEQTLTAAVDALEHSARERRSLERQVAELKASKHLLQEEKSNLLRERDSLLLNMEELKSDFSNLAAKVSAAFKDREQTKTSLIAVESETAKLLNWLIEEGRILEADDEKEAALEDVPSIPTLERSNSGVDADSRESRSSKSQSAQCLASGNLQTRPRSKSKLGTSKLSQSTSLSTLYASALTTAGVLTSSTSHNKLVAASCVSSDPSLFEGSLVPSGRKRTSSVSHLRLSVSSLSKRSESKLASSLTEMDARILQQLAQITELLKAVLSLQEETAKQLWEAKKNMKTMEVQVDVLGEWRDCVLQRVGQMNLARVPLLQTGSECCIQDCDVLTREISKRLCTHLTKTILKIPMTRSTIKLLVPLLILFVSLNLLALFLTLTSPVLDPSATHSNNDSNNNNRTQNRPSLSSLTKPKRLGAKCRHFVKLAKNPGKRFLNVKGLKLKKPPTSPKLPQQISFLHYNALLKNPRYLCSVESAARQNPNHQITVYAKNVSDFETVLAKLLLRDQVSVLELDWRAMFNETPLAEWYDNGTYLESKWVDQNLGNAFRLAIMWKLGGFYLDMDIISLNPLGALGTTLAKQTGPNILNNAVFGFQRRDLFVWEMMREFVDGFNGTVWGRNGPRMVDRTYNNLCKKKNGQLPTTEFSSCDAEIAPPSLFFPFSYGSRKKSLRPWKSSCDGMKRLADKSIGVHWWNKGLKGESIATETVLEAIMMHHCPITHRQYSAQELGFFSQKDIDSGNGGNWDGFEVADGF